VLGFVLGAIYKKEKDLGPDLKWLYLSQRNGHRDECDKICN
jgi:hypothetical protein